MKKFPDEKAAIDHFLNIRYKGNLICPHCGATINIYRYRERPKFFQCSSCNNTFSPFKDTIFKKTHLDLRLWFFAIKLFLNSRKGISGKQLQKELEVTYKTAWRVLHQLRIAMDNKEIEEEFSMFVQMDETYVGGKPRKQNNTTGKKIYYKRGRGTNKTPVVGIKETRTGRVYAKVMLPNAEGKKLTGKQLLDIIEKVCLKGTTVVSDDLSSYKILDKKRQRKKYGHKTVNHSKGEYYTKEGFHTNGIENFWSVLKRGIIGIYHHISVKYLQRYVDEFCFRQNTRLGKNMFDVLLGQCILV